MLNYKDYLRYSQGITKILYLLSFILLLPIYSCQDLDTVVDPVQTTGLPVIIINTPGSQSIESRNKYIEGANITILNPDATVELESVIKIRGRGNTSWKNPKKPYKIKFPKKTSLFGEPKDKEWALLANYTDKTMLRNALAFYMGQISNLDYTSSFHFVELVLNGEHQGTYMVAEQPKVSVGRVNVGDDGFLLEVDVLNDNADTSFKVSSLVHHLNIKYPDAMVGSADYDYIQNYIQSISDVLYGDSYTDPVDGYYKYYDIDSFVDWYLINEIARNNDSQMYASCFMHLERNGKLKMGPIWDFDIAFGNVSYNNNWMEEGFWVNRSTWMARFFSDGVFVDKLKKRMDYFYNHKNDLLSFIDKTSEQLYKSQAKNEEIWHTMNMSVYPNYSVCGTYDGEVTRLRQWLSDRLDWMQKTIQAM